MLSSLPTPPVGHRSRFFIVLPNGKRCSLESYVSSWKRLKQVPPETEITGWDWHASPARDILRELRRGVDDRINRRGGLLVPLTAHQQNAAEARVHRQLRRRVRHSCRWCGSPLGRYAPEHDRFCDAGCRRSFFS